MQIEIAHPQAIELMYPSLKKQDALKRQVEIDEAPMDIGQTRYETFPYTPRDDRKVKPASIWALLCFLVFRYLDYGMINI